MVKWMVVAASLMSGVAVAAPGDIEGPQAPPSRKGPFSGSPIEDLQEQREEKKTQAELEREERLRRLQEARSKMTARVVVLQERVTDANYTNDNLIRNIRTRIGRPDAKFYPDVDLYQNGRKERDPTLRPLDQRAKVPDEAIAQMNEAWKAIAAVPWNALDDAEWGVRASRLKALADSIWFVDRKELRPPLFNLYVQIGRAAENANNPLPPYFEQVAGINVNYYYYLAAAMAHRDPTLMADLTDPEVYQNVDYLRQRLDAGEFAPMTLNFELAGEFDALKFTSEYKVYFNGLEDQITNEQALFDVPPGRMDVYLERPGDGYGMSVRVESIKVDTQDLETVRDQARKRMGTDFIQQLMENPEQCIPDVEGDILNYLAIYQKLHEGQEVYIAVPEGGSIHKILLWRWDPEQGVLKRIDDNTGGFPVRFVALVGTGMSFNGASLTNPLSENSPWDIPEDVPDPADPLAAFPLDELVDLNASSVPMVYEMRGHWNRLMVGLTAEAGVPITGEGWNEVHQTQQVDHRLNEDGTTPVNGDRILLESDDGEEFTPLVKSPGLNRGLFLTVAGVAGKDAAYGFGPRAGLRTGWWNAPHVLDVSGHVGWSLLMSQDKKKEKPDSRVHMVVDTDLFAGAMVPFGSSLLLLSPYYPDDNDPDSRVWGRTSKEGNACVTAEGLNGTCDDGSTVRKFGRPMPNFGFTLRAGLTF